MQQVRNASKIDPKWSKSRLRLALEAGWGQLERGLGDIAPSNAIDANRFNSNFSIWEGFGKPLGVARGSRNLAFSRKGCSKSDFGLDG